MSENTDESVSTPNSHFNALFLMCLLIFAIGVGVGIMGTWLVMDRVSVVQFGMYVEPVPPVECGVDSMPYSAYDGELLGFNLALRINGLEVVVPINVLFQHDEHGEELVRVISSYQSTILNPGDTLGLPMTVAGEEHYIPMFKYLGRAQGTGDRFELEFICQYPCE